MKKTKNMFVAFQISGAISARRAFDDDFDFCDETRSLSALHLGLFSKHSSHRNIPRATPQVLEERNVFVE